MSTGMRATNPKLSKGGRKLKMAKHCTIPINLEVQKKKKNLKFEELYLNYGGVQKNYHNGEYVKMKHLTKFGEV